MPQTLSCMQYPIQQSDVRLQTSFKVMQNGESSVASYPGSFTFQCFPLLSLQVHLPEDLAASTMVELIIARTARSRIRRDKLAWISIATCHEIWVRFSATKQYRKIGVMLFLISAYSFYPYSREISWQRAHIAWDAQKTQAVLVTNYKENLDHSVTRTFWSWNCKMGIDVNLHIAHEF